MLLFIFNLRLYVNFCTLISYFTPRLNKSDFHGLMKPSAVMDKKKAS